MVQKQGYPDFDGKGNIEGCLNEQGILVENSNIAGVIFGCANSEFLNLYKSFKNTVFSHSMLLLLAIYKSLSAVCLLE